MAARHQLDHGVVNQGWFDLEEWDDIELLLKSGVIVQCVSIVVTSDYVSTVMEGYLKFIDPRAPAKSKHYLGKTENSWAAHANSSELTDILEHPYQAGRLLQQSLNF